MKRKQLIIIFYVIFLVFLMLFFLDKLDNFDHEIYNHIIKIKSDKVTNFFKFITLFGGFKFGLIIFIISLILTIFKNKKYIILNILLVFDTIINTIVKIITRRNRPIDINLITEKFYSFPSGHTMFSITFYGFIIYLINKSKLNKKLKIIFTILISIIIFLIMISRIYLGVHFASDVLAGMFLALANLLLFIEILERKKLC